MIGSYHIIPNAYLRDRVVAQSALTHYNSLNVLSMHALIGAYSQDGEAWLDGLKKVLSENVAYATAYIREHFEGVELFQPEGTYMLFIDCEKWLAAHGKTLDEVLAAGVKVGVIWQNGRSFHGPNHIRINLAVPTAVVKEAFDRLDKYVFNA